MHKRETRHPPIGFDSNIDGVEHFHSQADKASAINKLNDILTVNHINQPSYPHAIAKFDTIFGDEDIPHHIRLSRPKLTPVNSTIAHLLDDLLHYGKLPKESEYTKEIATRQRYLKYEQALASVPYCDDLYKQEILETEFNRELHRIKLNFTDKLTWDDVKSDSNC